MLTADRYIPMSMIEALRADTHRPMTPTHAPIIVSEVLDGGCILYRINQTITPTSVQRHR